MLYIKYNKMRNVTKLIGIPLSAQDSTEDPHQP